MEQVEIFYAKFYRDEDSMRLGNEINAWFRKSYDKIEIIDRFQTQTVNDKYGYTSVTISIFYKVKQ